VSKHRAALIREKVSAQRAHAAPGAQGLRWQSGQRRSCAREHKEYVVVKNRFHRYA
jgi:hypothetical protein